MSEDPSLALQGAIVAALKATPAVAGGRVLDDVPLEAEFPHLQVGEGETVGDDTECLVSSEVTMQVHVWSRAVGFPEARRIAGEVRARCTTAFALEGFTVVLAEHLQTRFLRDPDGLTSHAVVEFRYLVDHD
ncbi:gene transfer agent-like protein [Rhodovulum sp. PH10]|uniref:DUF3168 domain-containing protein n=1 Tax=Rhodovulum sp. PH10 TaxID=1187851 RepID=UPI00027C24AD|nr:DUF3168 domain-containing protein [Rhodovulum sp. PH10]EJW12735.1 gene transfer agent-like protein [Rhodovulum sp. PH10]